MTYRRVLLGALVLALAVLVVGCTEEHRRGPLDIPDTADAEAGRLAIQTYGCGTCHVIPGVAGANGRVGPSLEDIGNQLYIAGAVPNNLDNLVQWLQAADSIEPGTIMPTFGMAQETAVNIAAYLNDPD